MYTKVTPSVGLIVLYMKHDGVVEKKNMLKIVEVLRLVRNVYP